MSSPDPHWMEVRPGSTYLGMPIVTSPHVHPDTFILIDRTIFTSMTTDQLMVKLWVGDMVKSVRAHLAQLVADAERRLGLPA